MPNIDITNNDLGSVVIDADSNSFEDALLTFAGTDTFAAGTILARSAAKLVLYVPGSNTPAAVLVNETSRTGAGDVPVRALVAGKVNRDRLVIDNGTTVAAAHWDLLRSTSIIPVATEQLALIDNPQS